jgi:hypothetical protein
VRRVVPWRHLHLKPQSLQQGDKAPTPRGIEEMNSGYRTKVVRRAGGGDEGGGWRGIKKTSKEKDRKVVGWFSLKDITEFGPSIIIRMK